MKKIIAAISICLAIAGAKGVSAQMVGALMPTKDIPYYMAIHKSMVKELSTLNSDAEVILQKPSPNAMAWSNATRKLEVLGAEVVVAYGSATAICISNESKEIPIVYSGAYTPEGCGAQKRSTGMDATFPFEGLLDNLKKISNFSKLAILYSSSEVGSVKQMQAAEKIAKNMGAEVTSVDVTDFGSLELPPADALFLTSSAIINQSENLEAIVKKARVQKMATASVLGGTCELGVLISISANPEHQGKGTARMVAMILDGKNVSDIPPDKNPEIEMTVNLNEAKTLGFSVPFELLGTAKIVK